MEKDILKENSLRIQKQGDRLLEKVKRRQLLYGTLTPTYSFTEIIKNYQEVLNEEDIETIYLEEPKILSLKSESDFVDRVPEELYDCTIRREKRGIYKIYRLYLQYKNKSEKFLLSGKKSLFGGSYILSTDPECLSKASIVGRLKSNMCGSKYRIIKKDKEFGNIVIERNLFDWISPRKFQITLPSLESSEEFVLENRILDIPMSWVDMSENVLITKSSEKGEVLVMECLKLSDDSFLMQYRFPFCALQAFCVALSNLNRPEKW